MNIALIYGGRSGEHEVSINSAKGVYPPLCALGHTVFLIAITLEGRWFWQKEEEKKKEKKEEKKKEERKNHHALVIENDTTQDNQIHSEIMIGGEKANTHKSPIGTPIKTDYPLTIVPGEGIFCSGEKLPLDAAFAVTHGFGGEDGNLQGLCMLANLPLCGCSTLSSAIGMHKDIASKLFALEGIPTVPSLTLNHHDILWLEEKAENPPSWYTLPTSPTTTGRTRAQTSVNALLPSTRWAEACRILQEKVGPSLFVKPEDSGSSLGVTALRTPDGLCFKSAVLEAKRHSACVLVQALIEPMDELECALLETEEGNLIAAGPALVVDPGKQSNHFLSYAYKYTQVDSAYLHLPSSYPERIDQQIRLFAKQAFRAIGAEGYARIDFFVSGETIYLNEINTSPGMTSKSHYPLLMEHAGYSMEQVLETLIKGALRRKREETLRTYLPPGP
ncbi:MAG TPA: D-alanine--D-alanine ligase [Sphaerochaeta sp.]|nr:D-alanine--D-alanine ligase [Sphaerochaeta sp.]